MKIPLKHALLPALAVLAACGSGPDLAATENNLMDRHEKAMQQTAQLYELKAKIGPGSPTAAPYLHGLQAADNAMMTWMHHYQPDTTAAPAQRLAYLQQQQTALTAVEKQLQGTIDSATTFVKQLPAH